METSSVFGQQEKSSTAKWSTVAGSIFLGSSIGTQINLSWKFQPIWFSQKGLHFDLCSDIANTQDGAKVDLCLLIWKTNTRINSVFYVLTTMTLLLHNPVWMLSITAHNLNSFIFISYCSFKFLVAESFFLYTRWKLSQSQNVCAHFSSMPLL